jgi:hypothetical protein
MMAISGKQQSPSPESRKSADYIARADQTSVPAHGSPQSVSIAEGSVYKATVLLGLGPNYVRKSAAPQ